MSELSGDVVLICEANKNLALAVIRIEQLGLKRAALVCHALPDYPNFLRPLTTLEPQALQDFLVRGGIQIGLQRAEIVGQFLEELLRTLDATPLRSPQEARAA